MTAQGDAMNESARGALEEDEGPDLLDLLIDLVNHKWLILGAPVLAGVLGFGSASIIAPTYTATTTLMPPQQNQSSALSAMLGQLGGLASASALKAPGDLYVGMLHSRTVADALVQRFALQERYDVQFLDDARKELKKNSEISVVKNSGIITVSASDKDPQVATEMANAYVDELRRLTSHIAVTEASHRRLFFERQMHAAKEHLAQSEMALSGTQEKTGLIQPEEQIKALIGSLAGVRAAVAAKEVQLSSMRTYSTAQNPDLVRAQEELRALRAHLSKLERSQPADGDFAIPTRNMPAVGVEYIRALRNVKYHETLFGMLSKQFELAKIEEARDATVIQQLDKATKPERQSKPKRTVAALVAALACGLLAVIYALAREAYLRRGRHSDRWQRLPAAFYTGVKRQEGVCA